MAQLTYLSARTNVCVCVGGGGEGGGGTNIIYRKISIRSRAFIRIITFSGEKGGPL